MPQFAYKAVNSSGKKQSGSVDAADRRAAIQQLIGQGLRPVHVGADGRSDGPAPASSDEEPEAFFSNKSNPLQLGLMRKSKEQLKISLFQSMLRLLRSGLPLGDALKLLTNRLSDPDLKSLTNELWRQLSEGRTLARAMTGNSIFTDSECHLVEAGEASGNLVGVLERITDYLETNRALKKEVQGALAYPAFIMVVATVVVGIFVVFLLPRFESMLASLGGEMQWMAKFLLAGSDLFITYGPFVALAVLVGTVFIMNWRKTERGRYATDGWLLRLPALRNVFLYSNINDFTSLLATLLESGVNTTEALRLVEKTLPNRVLRQRFTASRRQIQEGVSFATALQRAHIMPDIALDILAVGENTGNIVTSLNDINRIYQEEQRKLLKLMTAVISVAALGSAFAFIGMIALTIVLSTFQLSNALVG